MTTSRSTKDAPSSISVALPACRAPRPGPPSPTSSRSSSGARWEPQATRTATALPMSSSVPISTTAASPTPAGCISTRDRRPASPSGPRGSWMGTSSLPTSADRSPPPATSTATGSPTSSSAPATTRAVTSRKGAPSSTRARPPGLPPTPAWRERAQSPGGLLWRLGGHRRRCQRRRILRCRRRRPVVRQRPIGRGASFLYHGSATGLATTPAWTGESNQATALFGTAVASAGDVNGDGYSDVIVSALLYDNGSKPKARSTPITARRPGSPRPRHGPSSRTTSWPTSGSRWRAPAT